MKIGYDEGDKCDRCGCNGIIETHPVENCSCHISPPCSACTSARNYCPVCGWEERNDPIEETETLKHNYTPTSIKKRILDNTKIDYVCFGHSNSSMIKRGVYPLGTEMKDVRKVVNGTFGGRFTSFKNGHFEFIAYTD